MAAGQSKARIEGLLAAAGRGPNRKLGQHFLTDLNLMRLLVETAGVCEQDAVLEVGTGTGSLTEMLAEQAGRVVTVEVDAVLAGVAQAAVREDVGEMAGKVRWVVGDVLAGKHRVSEEVLAALGETVKEVHRETGGRYKLVANLPYVVSAPLMINLLEGELVCEGMWVTVQTEVAERMVAGPGGHHYGTLSILLQAMGEIRIFRKAAPPAFWPMPNVQSSMVSWVRDEEKAAGIASLGRLKQVVEMLLGHRRKTVKANLRLAAEGEAAAELLEEAGIEPGERGEMLGWQKYVALANLLEAKRENCFDTDSTDLH